MAYLEQLDRVRRALIKLENLSTAISTENVSIPTHAEYVDALYFYFQNCWHLKDWIRNDVAAPTSLKAAVQRMEAEQDWVHSLMLCADIANGSKHFLQTRNIRVGAKAQGQIMVRASESVFGGQPTSTSVQFQYQIVEGPAGATHDALDVARKALSDWENLITTNGGAV
jgi:hypothetical protein